MRQILKSQMNPNVDVPVPKTIEILKRAVKLSEYDKSRQGIDKIPDLQKQSSDPLPAVYDHAEGGAELLQAILGRKLKFRKQYKKKRGENEIKMEFVDSSKAIQGSSDEEVQTIKNKRKQTKAPVVKEEEEDE